MVTTKKEVIKNRNEINVTYFLVIFDISNIF